MSNYQTAVADLLRQRREQGQEDVPLNLLIIGRAIDAALPGKLSAKNGNFYVDSNRIDGPADLIGTVRIPGVRFKHLLMVGDQTGLVDVNNPPPAVLYPFGVGSISAQVGAINLEFIGSLSKIWQNRIKPSGLLTDDQVKAALALLSVGIIVIPETAERLTADYPRMPDDLRQPPNISPERRAAWYKIAEGLRPALSTYYKAQVADAAAATAAAERDAAFWDSVYKATEAVRDLPATAAGAGLDLAGSAVKSAFGVFFQKPFLIIAGLGVVGVALWWFWPRLARAAAAKATELRDA